MRSPAFALFATLALALGSAGCSGAGAEAAPADESAAAVVATVTPGIYDRAGSPYSIYVRADGNGTVLQLSHREFDCHEVRLTLTKTGGEAHATEPGCDLDLVLAASGSALTVTGKARLPRAIGDFGVPTDALSREVQELGEGTWTLRDPGALAGTFAAYDEREAPMDGKLTVRGGNAGDGKLSLSIDYLESGATTRATADAIGPATANVTAPGDLTSHEEYRASFGRCDLVLHGGRNGRGEALFYVMRVSAGCPALGTWYRRAAEPSGSVTAR